MGSSHTTSTSTSSGQMGAILVGALLADTEAPKVIVGAVYGGTEEDSGGSKSRKQGRI